MRRLIFMIMEIKRNIADNHVSAYAAQAAYFIMLSLIPLLILLLSMIQFTGIGKADFYSLIQHLVPQGFQSWMLSIIDEMFSRTVATVSLSAVVTIWSAGKSFMALNRGFNAICRVDKNPNYVLMRLRGAVFALLFVVIIMVSLVLVVFGDSIHLWLVKYIPFVAGFTRIILSFRHFIVCCRIEDQDFLIRCLELWQRLWAGIYFPLDFPSMYSMEMHTVCMAV